MENLNVVTDKMDISDPLLDKLASGQGNGDKIESRLCKRDAVNVCDKLSLNYVNIGSYLVAMRSEFDAMIAGEPYVAAMLLIDLKSGSYFERIWNQTVARGKALNLGDFVDECQRFFKQRARPCLGLPIETVNDELRNGCLISQTPVPRMMSKSCLRVVHEEASDKVSSC